MIILILQTAGLLFNKHGIRNVTIQDITRHQGISTKTFYKYYDSKEEVLKQVIIYGTNEDIKYYTRAKKESKDAIEQFLMITSHSYAKNENMHKFFIAETKKYYPDTFNLLDDFVHTYILRYIKSIIVKGISEGIFRRDLNPEIQAYHNIYSIMYSLLRISIKNNKYSTGKLFKEVQKHFLYGLCNEKGLILIKKYSKDYPLLFI